MSSQETRAALMDAAVRLTATSGTKALTARGIAGEAGVNQALVYYHFQGIEGLLKEAYERATLAMIEEFSADLDGVNTFEGLYAVGAKLAERAAEDGSASLLSSVIAAAHTDEQMADMLRASMDHWRAAISATVRRILDARGLAGAVDIDAMTSSLAASTIGMVTIGAVPSQPLGDPLIAVQGLPGLLDRILRLVPAPLARRIFGTG
jgi:AcrR family transcriptional regulator